LGNEYLIFENFKNSWFFLKPKVLIASKELITTMAETIKHGYNQVIWFYPKSWV
jgi:hypothetical protein